MLGHDMRQGIVRRLGWLLLPAGLFLVIMLMSQSVFVRFRLELGREPALGAYLLHLFSGCLPASEANRDFSIPLEWMLVQIGCLVFTVEYPSRDLESAYGMQILVRGGSRLGWWHAKCLWNTVSVCLYYGALYLTALLYCLWTGAACTLRLEAEEIVQLLHAAFPTQASFSGTETAPVLLGMPVLAMVGVSLWQMVISVSWHPAYGFAGGIVLLVCSAFAQASPAIGNYTMMQRCTLFYPGGLSFRSGVWVILACIAAAVVAGDLTMRRRNILTPMQLGG